MAKVIIKNEGKEFEVPNGARLMSYAKRNSNMLFGCEKGECGTCICTVLEGEENIPRRNQREEITLAGLSANLAQRLGCQLTIKNGKVVIEY